jgi:hypothetical protein
MDVVNLLNKKVIWTPQQDLLLMRFSKIEKCEWEQVSKHILSKNPDDCRERHRILEATSQLSEDTKAKLEKSFER